MKIINALIPGLNIIEPKIFEDKRGKFIKVFSDNLFAKNKLNIDIKEVYYSISHKNVIRGMHFQIPPYDHIKIVFVSRGSIIDVVLDIRKNSPTYGKYFSINLSDKNGKVLFIPKGLAHGFKALEDNTIVNYMQTTCYSSEHDKGIRYDSFGFDWKCENPKISDRDKAFPKLKEFNTPFEYGE